MRVPDHQHAIIASIRSHNPVFVVTAEDRGNLVAMALQQLLLLCHVVVDDTGVGSRVKDLSSILICEEVHSLVNVLVETVDLAKRLSFVNTQRKSSSANISRAVTQYITHVKFKTTLENCSERERDRQKGSDSSAVV